MQWLQGCRSTTACPRTGLLFGCQKRISGGSCFEGLKIVRPWRRVGVPLEYLRCAQLANASRVLGNLGDDILSKTFH